MAKARIFTVGFDLPGSDFEHVNFSSDQTLLDADITLFKPTTSHIYWTHEGYQGHQLARPESSAELDRECSHWKSELIAAANSGKLVVVYLARPKTAYKYTGERNVSGTGRSQKVTNIVVPFSCYDAVPCIMDVQAKSGTAIKLTDRAAVLRPYWAEFGPHSAYEAVFTAKDGTPLLVSTSGDRTIGAMYPAKSGGAVLFLPPLGWDEQVFLREDDEGELVWTSEAIKFGRRLAANLRSLAASLAEESKATPPPSWVGALIYRLHRR
jgi:hypothetical protein